MKQFLGKSCSGMSGRNFPEKVVLEQVLRKPANPANTANPARVFKLLGCDCLYAILLFLSDLFFLSHSHFPCSFNTSNATEHQMP